MSLLTPRLISSPNLKIAGLAFALGAPASLFAAFGVTSSSGYYVVDSGAGLVFKVNQTNGDIPSIKFNGTEVNSTAKASQLASGLGSATVTATTSGNYIVVTCATSSSNTVAASLTHYYIVQNGVNNIYMATYVTSEPSVGELRFVLRAQRAVLPNGPAGSNNSNATGNIESQDVFGNADGTTTSKYYGNAQAKNLTVQGGTGTNLGIFVAFGNRESSSGGPFFRDIEDQNGGNFGDGAGADHHIYNYMNSNHEQTEAYRTNVLHGPYAYCFTTGATPSVPDMSFISSLGLTGYVSNTGRGNVVLNGLSGMDAAYTYTLGFANATAQYWVTTSSTGSATCGHMKPGTYTMTVYKGELAVYTESVTVTAGASTTLNTRTITGDPSTKSTIWRIGNWDGTPNEFLNGQTFALRHPSDSRNASWGPVTYPIGSATNKFPAAQFRAANTPTTITFNLTSAQVAAHTLRIGITCAYASGRPYIVVNPGTANAWTSASPAASTQPSSRSMTIGTYRGNNTTYTYSIPSTAFIASANTIQIQVASGSSDLSTWLTPSFTFDCVDFY